MDKHIFKNMRLVDEEDRPVERASRVSHVVPELLETLAGTAAGAAAGLMGGPPGVVAGAIIGTLVGAGAAVALDADREATSVRQAALDRTIGVVGGSIGAASPNAPPARIGAFSIASMGISSHGPDSSDGPMQNVESD
jgi:hypothetical protein